MQHAQVITSTQVIERDAPDALENHPLVSLLPLIRLIGDGQWHTGVTLGETLGVSRAAIWKQLKKLDDYGLTLFTHPQKGYRLAYTIDWLKAHHTLSLVPSNIESIQSFRSFCVIDSTNQYLLDHWKRLAGGVSERLSLHVCTAEWQNLGRGRRGKQWVSPLAGNICLSVGWLVSGGAAALEGISLVAGLVLSESLEALGFKEVQLKWPNDVLVKGRKLAGLLVEIRGDISGDCFCVLGVGLNVAMSQHHSNNIGQDWVDLEQLAKEQAIACPSRERILGTFLERLVTALRRHNKHGFGFFSDAWQSRDAFFNQPVRFQQGSDWYEGVARGINEQGALKITTENNESVLLHGGEISVRRLCDS